jgi:hypothetical protein
MSCPCDTVSPMPHFWIAADILEYGRVRDVVVACVACPGGAGVVPPPLLSLGRGSIASPHGCVTYAGVFCPCPRSPKVKHVSVPWSSNCTTPPWQPNRPATIGADQSLSSLTSSQDCASSGINVHLVRLGDLLPGCSFPPPNWKMFPRIFMMTCYSFRLRCSSVPPFGFSLRW